MMRRRITKNAVQRVVRFFATALLGRLRRRWRLLGGSAGLRRLRWQCKRSLQRPRDPTAQLGRIVHDALGEHHFVAAHLSIAHRIEGLGSVERECRRAIGLGEQHHRRASEQAGEDVAVHLRGNATEHLDRSSMRGSFGIAAWKIGWFSGGTLTHAMRRTLPRIGGPRGVPAQPPLHRRVDARSEPERRGQVVLLGVRPAEASLIARRARSVLLLLGAPRASLYPL